MDEKKTSSVDPPSKSENVNQEEGYEGSSAGESELKNTPNENIVSSQINNTVGLKNNPQSTNIANSNSPLAQKTESQNLKAASKHHRPNIPSNMVPESEDTNSLEMRQAFQKTAQGANFPSYETINALETLVWGSPIPLNENEQISQAISVTGHPCEPNGLTWASCEKTPKNSLLPHRQSKGLAAELFELTILVVKTQNRFLFYKTFPAEPPTVFGSHGLIIFLQISQQPPNIKTLFPFEVEKVGTNTYRPVAQLELCPLFVVKENAKEEFKNALQTDFARHLSFIYLEQSNLSNTTLCLSHALPEDNFVFTNSSFNHKITEKSITKQLVLKTEYVTPAHNATISRNSNIGVLRTSNQNTSATLELVMSTVNDLWAAYKPVPNWNAQKVMRFLTVHGLGQISSLLQQQQVSVEQVFQPTHEQWAKFGLSLGSVEHLQKSLDVCQIGLFFHFRGSPLQILKNFDAVPLALEPREFLTQDLIYCAGSQKCFQELFLKHYLDREWEATGTDLLHVWNLAEMVVHMTRFWKALTLTDCLSLFKFLERLQYYPPAIKLRQCMETFVAKCEPKSLCNSEILNHLVQWKSRTYKKKMKIIDKLHLRNEILELKLNTQRTAFPSFSDVNQFTEAFDELLKQVSEIECCETEKVEQNKLEESRKMWTNMLVCSPSLSPQKIEEFSTVFARYQLQEAHFSALDELTLGQMEISSVDDQKAILQIAAEWRETLIGSKEYRSLQQSAPSLPAVIEKIGKLNNLIFQQDRLNKDLRNDLMTQHRIIENLQTKLNQTKNESTDLRQLVEQQSQQLEIQAQTISRLTQQIKEMKELQSLFASTSKQFLPSAAILKGHTDIVRSVAFSPDGRFLASCSKDKTICLWDSAHGGEPRLILKGHTECVYQVVFSPDGRTLVSVSGDKTMILWDLASSLSAQAQENQQDKKHQQKQRRQVFQGHTGAVRAVAFSPNGKMLASASDDKTICVWDTEHVVQKILILKGHTERIRGVCFSPDGRTVASASDDKTICVWAITADQKIFILKGHTNAVNQVAFHPSNNTIASASEGSVVRIWELPAGKHKLALKSHSAGVKSVAFSPDGKLLASASADHSICIWDALSGTLKTTLKGHTDVVDGLAFHPCSSVLASASWDGTVRQWDVRQYL